MPGCGEDQRRFIFSSVQPVSHPLGYDPLTQLWVFAVALRNIAVLVGFAILGKLAQTLLPGVALAVPFETQAFKFSDTGATCNCSFALRPTYLAWRSRWFGVGLAAVAS
jgi:hypothetical protein